jgi:hypothetical protein
MNTLLYTGNRHAGINFMQLVIDEDSGSIAFIAPKLEEDEIMSKETAVKIMSEYGISIHVYFFDSWKGAEIVEAHQMSFRPDKSNKNTRNVYVFSKECATNLESIFGKIAMLE